MSNSISLPPELLLASIVASSNDAIIAKNLDGVIIFWNKAAEHLLGHRASDIIGQNIAVIIPPGRRDEEVSIIDRVSKGETLSHFETERLAHDGRVIAVSITVSPIYDHHGAIIGVTKIARDLTATARLYAEAAGSNALFRSILDTVTDGLVVIDRKGCIQFFNPAAQRMFGYSAEEAIGCNVSLLMPSPHADAHDSYLARYVATGEKRIMGIGRVVVGRRRDGTTFPMELQIGEASTPGADLFTGFVRDLTEWQEQDRRLTDLQAELIHVSRLSELGQMVSTLAHEVNQPLTAISNYLSGVNRFLNSQTPEPLRHAIEKAVEQCERVRGIIRSLRGLVKKESVSRSIENIETIIHEMSALALMGNKNSIRLAVKTPVDATFILANKTQIQQVLLNLIRNAAEAMVGASQRKIIVTTERVGNRINVIVADTGPGLPEIVTKQIFQPFVTTKPDGVGIGLSICRTIVEAHGGKLTLESAPGEGTTVRFSVPVAPSAHEPG